MVKRLVWRIYPVWINVILAIAWLAASVYAVVVYTVGDTNEYYCDGIESSGCRVPPLMLVGATGGILLLYFPHKVSAEAKADQSSVLSAYTIFLSIPQLGLCISFFIPRKRGNIGPAGRKGYDQTSAEEVEKAASIREGKTELSASASNADHGIAELPIQDRCSAVEVSTPVPEMPTSERQTAAELSTI